MTNPLLRKVVQGVDRFIGDVGNRRSPAAGTSDDAAPIPLTDGVVLMTIAALATSAAVLATAIWFVATFMKGTGMGGLGLLFLIAAGGGLTLVPIAAGLALRLRRRPLAARTAWVLLQVFVVLGILNSTVAYPVFFSEALFVVLGLEVIVGCVAARAYTIWRATT